MHVFLSHAHEDRAIAEEIAGLIQRLTLQQVRAWYSSDMSPASGLSAGTPWLDEVAKKLRESAAMIVLVTPRSSARPWLYFEAGLAAADARAKIVPVCVGLSSVQHLPMPLSLYQSFQLEDSASLKQFLRKMLPLCGVAFDEEMAEPLIARAVAALMERRGTETDRARPLTTSDVDQIVSRIQSVVSAGIAASISASASMLSMAAGDGAIDEPGGAVEHNVTIDVDVGGGPRPLYLTVGEHEEVQSVLDRVYSAISTRVGPFTYFQSWVLREKESRVVLGSKASLVRLPARDVFAAGAGYEVVLLKEPYWE